MTEENGKRFVRQVLATVVSGLILNILIVGGFVLKMSYQSEVINNYQDKQITEIKLEQKEMKRDIKEQYYALINSINELKEKMK
jgi:hypothetical protein